MSENQKTPEAMVGEAVAHALSPVLATMAENIKSVLESNAETKSVKEEFEAKSKEIEAKAEAEIKSVKEEFHARLDELTAKKSVNVG